MTTQTFQKPTIFISSTIYDFRDLRSSLKYYLEELGYIVNMSEFNDFQRELDENSYTACLNTVKSSDYFILLIGSRVGGIYNEVIGTTITQEEYRAAYENSKTGKTRILAFVRNDVWTIKEDRAALAKLLQSDYVTSGELDVGASEKLSSHASKFVTDANRIFTFINEVCRVAEMKTAIVGNGSLPPANWVHRFETFRDIVDALRIQLDVTGDIKTKILVDNLRSELLSNLASMSTKYLSGNIMPITVFTDPFRKRYILKLGEKVEADCKHVRLMVQGSIFLHRKIPLRWRALEHCIDNGIFMAFDTSSGTIKRTAIHDALERLRISIEQYMACDLAGESPKLVKKYLEAAKRSGTMKIESHDFAVVIHAANKLDDIMSLAKTIFSYTNGEAIDIDGLPLKPRSPFSDDNESLAEEEISVDEIASWLTNR